jgi:hypothetical protein
MYAERAKERRRQATERGNKPRHGHEAPVSANPRSLAPDEGKANDQVTRRMAYRMGMPNKTTNDTAAIREATLPR